MDIPDLYLNLFPEIQFRNKYQQYATEELQRNQRVAYIDFIKAPQVFEHCKLPDVDSVPAFWADLLSICQTQFHSVQWFCYHVMSRKQRKRT